MVSVTTLFSSGCGPWGVIQLAPLFSSGLGVGSGWGVGEIHGQQFSWQYWITSLQSQFILFVQHENSPPANTSTENVVAIIVISNIAETTFLHLFLIILNISFLKIMWKCHTTIIIERIPFSSNWQNNQTFYKKRLI